MQFSQHLVTWCYATELTINVYSVLWYCLYEVTNGCMFSSGFVFSLCCEHEDSQDDFVCSFDMKESPGSSSLKIVRDIQYVGGKKPSERDSHEKLVRCQIFRHLERQLWALRGCSVHILSSQLLFIGPKGSNWREYQIIFKLKAQIHFHCYPLIGAADHMLTLALLRS